MQIFGNVSMAKKIELVNCSSSKRQKAMEGCCKSIIKIYTDYKVFIMRHCVDYLNGCKCLISYLLGLRELALCRTEPVTPAVAYTGLESSTWLNSADVCARLPPHMLPWAEPRLRQNYKQYAELCWKTALAYVNGHKKYKPSLILGLRPSSKRRRYKVTPPLIGWAQT